MNANVVLSLIKKMSNTNHNNFQMMSNAISDCSIYIHSFS